MARDGETSEDPDTVAPPCAPESSAGGSVGRPPRVGAGEAGAVVGDSTGGGRTSRSPRVECVAAGAELEGDTPDPPSGRLAASTSGFVAVWS